MALKLGPVVWLPGAGGLCCAALCGVAAFLLVLILRGTFGRATSGPQGFRVVDDGFWLPPGRYTPGTQLSYRCRTGSRMRTGNFMVQRGPRGQFIYTGDRPEDIEILNVMPAEEPDDTDNWDQAPSASQGSGGDFGDKAEAAPSSKDDFPPASESDSGSGGDFPSAY
jgi:hypothetical protein